MADQQQLDLLRQGVDTWNTWRKQHREVRLNLSGADLSGAILSRAIHIGRSTQNPWEADLSGVDLSGVNLTSPDLSGANLISANLSRANLTLAHLNPPRLLRPD